jgi:hypothetical protein
MSAEDRPYFGYTAPLRFDKAIHSLEGIIEGITIDGKVNDHELRMITKWIGSNSEFLHRKPFSEILTRINTIIADGVIDEEEKADILWLCNKLTTDSQYFCQFTSDLQRLHGMLGGIACDLKITVDELKGLQVWIDEHPHLKTYYPYDELEALILEVLKDGVIDAEEHKILLAYFNEFLKQPGHNTIALPEIESLTVAGVCTICPDITFEDRVFCFTGESDTLSRDDFRKRIEDRGGKFSNTVSKKTDYLTIGAKGNDCWAYSCYGRKVEKAIQLRKEGSRILLVHEYDLCDAIADFDPRE